jgi:hypothetical protein
VEASALGLLLRVHAERKEVPKRVREVVELHACRIHVRAALGTGGTRLAWQSYYASIKEATLVATSVSGASPSRAMKALLRKP